MNYEIAGKEIGAFVKTLEALPEDDSLKWRYPVLVCVDLFALDIVDAATHPEDDTDVWYDWCEGGPDFDARDNLNIAWHALAEAFSVDDMSEDFLNLLRAVERVPWGVPL